MDLKDYEETPLRNGKNIQVYEDEQTHRGVYLGCGFAVLAAMNAAASYGVNKMFEGEKAKVAMYRSFFQLLVLYPMINFMKVDIIGPDMKTTGMLLLRGLVAGLAVLLLTLAVEYLSLGDLTAIFYTFPALVGIFSRLCLKESCGVVRVLLTIVTFVGLVLVSEPSFIFGSNNEDLEETTRWPGIIMSFASAVMCALDCIILRKLGISVHFSLSLLYLSVECLIISIIYLAAVDQFTIPCQSDFIIILGTSFFGFLGQILMVLSLQRVKAGTVSLLLTTQVLFAYIFQYIFFQTVPSLYGAIGAALIMICAISASLKTILGLKRKLNV